MELIFRKIESDWNDPVRSAFNQVFGCARSHNEWDHLYNRCPDGGLGFIATTPEDRVVGHYGVTLHKLSTNASTQIYAGYGRDAFVRPEFRGGGIGKLSVLGRLFENICEECVGVGLILGFASQRHGKLGALRLGYRSVDSTRLWQRDIQINTSRLPQRVGLLCMVSTFSEDIDQLSCKLTNPDVLMLNRDARFLNWRFTSDSGRRYQLYEYRSFCCTGIAAYAVIRMDGGDCKLIDFRFPDQPELRYDFWHQLQQVLGSRGGRHIFCLASIAVHDSVYLKEFGFEKMQEPTDSVPNYFSLALAAENISERLHLTWADSDTV